VNDLDDEWGDQPEGWSGGGGRSKRLVERGPLVGASVYELDPGNHSVRNDSDEAVRTSSPASASRPRSWNIPT
jgi:hypothetical protein